MKKYWKSQGILSEEKSGNPVRLRPYDQKVNLSINSSYFEYPPTYHLSEYTEHKLPDQVTLEVSVSYRYVLPRRRALNINIANFAYLLKPGK